MQIDMFSHRDMFGLPGIFVLLTGFGSFGMFGMFMLTDSGYFALAVLQ